jgi:hypothetical protein
LLQCAFAAVPVRRWRRLYQYHFRHLHSLRRFACRDAPPRGVADIIALASPHDALTLPLRACAARHMLGMLRGGLVT